VPGDTNSDGDVFVRDRKKGKTKRVSVRSNGAQGDDDSIDASISANGRFVAFASRATNMVKNDTNAAINAGVDIFVHDRATGRTRRVSVRSNGKQANDRSRDPAISANGRFVVFRSVASNLVKNDTNGEADIFIHDRKSGKTRRVSVRSNGKQGIGGSADNPAVSATGRFVVFESKQRNLVKNDTNEKSDIFVHDRATKKTRRVSVRTNGTQGDDASRDPSISGDGRFVVYESLATNLINNDTNGRVDIYVRDRKKGKTKRVSVRSDGTESMDGQADDPVISGDGRMIAWEDSADDLAGAGNIDEGDIFIRDRKKNKTRRVSVSTAGVAGDDGSLSPAFSGDGRFVLFESDATNLVSVLTVDDRDVYIRGPLR
jgi:hypothetical protein